MRERVRLCRRRNQCTQGVDHVENAGEVALVESMDRDVAADQPGGDLGLKIGECEDQIGFEREDSLEVGGNEGGDARLLLAHLRRAHRIAGHPDDAPLLAQEIKGFHGLFGETDDALGREHGQIVAMWRRPCWTKGAAIAKDLGAGRRLDGGPPGRPVRRQLAMRSCNMLR